ncbi:MAG: hypothetical protein ABI968_14645 [Acidobacteriota bacterium]
MKSRNSRPTLPALAVLSWVAVLGASALPLRANAFSLAAARQANLIGAQKPLTIEVISPKLGLINFLLPSSYLPREMAGGWPLTIRLTANNELGIGTAFLPPFPEDGTTGFLIFKDPDGCPSFSPVIIATQGPCFNAPVDETFFEFTNDTDMVGVPDPSGNDFLQIALTDSFGGGAPRMLVFSNGTNSFLQAYGPPTSAPNSTDTLVQRCVSRFGVTNLVCSSDGDCVGPFATSCQTVPSEVDGIGWGANDDSPGLVLLADTGPSLVLGQDFNPPAGPKQIRNSAGFITSVAWELNDSTKHSNVVAHMNVPQRLFQPVVQFDTCVGTPPVVFGGPCGSPNLFRIDGGPEITDISGLADVVTTLRIFVVNGAAPATVSDLDGNGIVDSKDAVAAGYKLISPQATLRFRTLSQDEIPGFLVDLGDKNGLVPAPPLPAGGGTITPIPR